VFRSGAHFVSEQQACGALERSLASGQAAASSLQSQHNTPRHGRELVVAARRGIARGLNIQASKSVSAVAAARPVAWLRPTRSSGSPGGRRRHALLSPPNQPLQRTAHAQRLSAHRRPARLSAAR
jgi:hypothetical protein